jgi:hypothetical protein
VNDTSFTFVTTQLAGGGPTEGAWHAAFGPTDPGGGGIIQAIATTAGHTTSRSISRTSAALRTPSARSGTAASSRIDFDVPGFNDQTFKTAPKVRGLPRWCRSA